MVWYDVIKPPRTQACSTLTMLNYWLLDPNLSKLTTYCGSDTYNML